jgi:hypothetical protein
VSADLVLTARVREWGADDSDYDGASYLQEVWWGSDPFDDQSMPPLVPGGDGGDGDDGGSGDDDDDGGGTNPPGDQGSFFQELLDRLMSSPYFLPGVGVAAVAMILLGLLKGRKRGAKPSGGSSGPVDDFFGDSGINFDTEF